MKGRAFFSVDEPENVRDFRVTRVGKKNKRKLSNTHSKETFIG